MECNIGKVDRSIRFILGVLFLMIAYFNDYTWLYVIALLLIVTASVKFCWLYRLIKFNSCKR
jgi:hypothetical protein